MKQPLPTPSQNSKNPQLCIQVITSAKDPKSGQCRDFPTPCDVPAGWEKVQKCSFDNEEKFCGGIANIECPTDYKCQLDGSYPDAGGKCVKK